MKRRYLVLFFVLVLMGVPPDLLAAKQAAVREAAAPPQTITNAKDGSELILIPAGEFKMGSPDGEGGDDEHPQHRVSLDAYCIGKYEVTNGQFAKFVEETGYNAGGDWKKQYNSGTAAHPVVCVSWNDAKAYCDWASLRLPTEAEWEKAARGTDGRKYPWGNKWDAGRCNNPVGGSSSGTKPVGSYSNGSSPYGCLDMAGNVWEWCNDWYEGNYYRNSPQRNPQGPGSGQYKVLRGGGWYFGGPDIFRCAYRDYKQADDLGGAFGFRVCRSADIR